MTDPERTLQNFINWDELESANFGEGFVPSDDFGWHDDKDEE
jgi:hypothetical protein